MESQKPSESGGGMPAGDMPAEHKAYIVHTLNPVIEGFAQYCLVHFPKDPLLTMSQFNAELLSGLGGWQAAEEIRREIEQNPVKKQYIADLTLLLDEFVETCHRSRPPDPIAAMNRFAQEKALTTSETKVFWSGNLTDNIPQMRRDWLDLSPDAPEVAKASMPAFNHANGKFAVPPLVQKIDVPCYGLIVVAITQLFEDLKEPLGKVAAQVGVTMPVIAFNGFVQGRMFKVTDLVAYLREHKDFKATEAEAINKLENFVTMVKEAKPSDNWQEKMDNTYGDDWLKKNEFPDLLSNFGFSDKAADMIRDTDQTFYRYPPDEKFPDGEKVGWEDHALRWVSKGFLLKSSYPGCLVDVLNLIFAMEGIEYQPEIKSETGSVIQIASHTPNQIIDIVNGFKHKLQNPKQSSWNWVPTHFWMDMELDDLLCWVLLEYVYQYSNSQRQPLRVLVQLPAAVKHENLDFKTLGKEWQNKVDPVTEANKIFDGLAVALEKRDGVFVARDKGSRNLNKLLNESNSLASKNLLVVQ